MVVNTAHIISNGNDSVKVRNQDLKIGKVYKKYVEEQLASIRQRGLKN
jgi:hypothetical protein